MFRVIYGKRVKEAMMEDIVATAVRWNVFTHDDILSVACDDSVDEACLAEQTIYTAVF